jgi:hypothetical protein
MTDPTPLPTFLPVRLQRETPFKSQLGCTGVIALVLLAVAALAWYAAGSEGKGSNWVGYVVGVGFGFFGLLVLWSFIRQLGAAGLKETVVEISREPLQPGETAKICLIQPGPARLKSLRANLLCFEERTHRVWNSQRKLHEDRTEERLVTTENLVDAQHLSIPVGDVWHEVREFTLPSDARVAGTVDGLTVRWKIEVWGTGYALASFMHPFPVDVYKGVRPEEDE